MKIIATSDWHIGNLFHGIDRLPEHEHFMAWLKDVIKTQEADALLVAGDIFDNGNPSAAAQNSITVSSTMSRMTTHSCRLSLLPATMTQPTVSRLLPPSSIAIR